MTRQITRLWVSIGVTETGDKAVEGMPEFDETLVADIFMEFERVEEHVLDVSVLLDVYAS